MSSDVLARVEAFAIKASELTCKGHLLRAAENFCRGAEAARALGEDNLVVVNQQMWQGDMLRAFATAPEAATADSYVLVAAHRDTSTALLSDAIAVLERRHAAGTLLEGKCAAVEEAWRAALWRRLNPPNLPAALVASWAALFGYELFLHAAMSAFTMWCAHYRLACV